MLIPVNFLLSLVCLLLLLQRRATGWPWRALLLICLVHTLNAGLVALPDANGWPRLLPVTATALPLLCRAALAQAMGRRPRYLAAAGAILTMAAAVAWLPQAIDPLLPAVWLGCAAAMLHRLRGGSDAFYPLAFSHSALTVTGWRIAAWLLVAVALLDVTVTLLFDFAAGAGTGGLLLGGNLLICAVLSVLLVLAPVVAGGPGPAEKHAARAGDEAAGAEAAASVAEEGAANVADPGAAVCAGAHRPVAAAAQTIAAHLPAMPQTPGSLLASGGETPLPGADRACTSRGDAAQQSMILAAVEGVMREGLYQRADLNLLMLARKTGIPARQVSAAINAVHRQSVSHYVNGWRIAEAMRLLVESNASVIVVMEQAGFQTKSNFNREFRRITGLTPTAWRSRHSEQAEIVP